MSKQAVSHEFDDVKRVNPIRWCHEHILSYSGEQIRSLNLSLNGSWSPLLSESDESQRRRAFQNDTLRSRRFFSLLDSEIIVREAFSPLLIGLWCFTIYTYPPLLILVVFSSNVLYLKPLVKGNLER